LHLSPSLCQHLLDFHLLFSLSVSPIQHQLMGLPIRWNGWLYSAEKLQEFGLFLFTNAFIHLSTEVRRTKNCTVMLYSSDSDLTAVLSLWYAL
jgi:hypothetical protein